MRRNSRKELSLWPASPLGDRLAIFGGDDDDGDAAEVDGAALSSFSSSSSPFAGLFVPFAYDVLRNVDLNGLIVQCASASHQLGYVALLLILTTITNTNAYFQLYKTYLMTC